MAKLTWHNLCKSSSCSWLALCHRIFVLILGIPTTDWSNSLLESIGSSLQDFEACEMFLTGKGSSLGDESSQSLLSLGSGGVVERFVSKKSLQRRSQCVNGPLEFESWLILHPYTTHTSTAQSHGRSIAESRIAWQFGQSRWLSQVCSCRFGIETIATYDLRTDIWPN